MKPIYVGLGLFFFALGAAGAVLPLLPSTPFLLLSALCFARGSDRFNQWFLSTRLYKNHLESFIRTRSMKLRTKIITVGFASSMLALAFILSNSFWVKGGILLAAAFKYYYFIFRIRTESPRVSEASNDAPRKRSKMMDSRLLALVEHSRQYIALGVLMNWIGLLANVCAVITVATMLQRGWEGQLTGGFTLLACGIIAGSIGIRCICAYVASLLSWRSSNNAKQTLRTSLYRKLLKLGVGYTERTSTAGAVQISVEGVEQLEHYFGRYMPQLFYSLLAPLTLFVILSFISFKSALILLICVPLIPVSIIAIMRFARKLFSKYWGSYVNLGNGFLENLQGLTTLKIYAADEQRHEEMNATAESFRRMTMRVLRMQLNSVAIMDIIAYGGAAIGVIIAANEFAAGRIPLWGALTVMLLSAEFFIPLRLLGSYFHIAMNGMAASDKIFELLELDERQRGNGTIHDGSIQLEQLSFSYNGAKREAGQTTLKDINLDIPQGSLTAFVGQSGSGKSTLAALMMGFVNGYEGRLIVGGSERRDILEQTVMQRITLVSLGSHIFKGTVKENLRMGAPAADEDDLLQALEQVNLREFVLSQGGLSYALEEQGANLSGGQRQRMALARALLHDSDIYIFDEATSNIDVESEEKIMEVIHTLARRKTIILISHRLANVVQADCIHVLSEGRLVESGTHRELLGLNGHYAALFNSQQQIEQFAKGGMAYA
ncbi:DUF454 family protein [Paenibacillus medicaginis]|uniref:DUF454 family protein n=1 Tax=Paenibacillus medicaginis TaxID=1470560 RepID=A0ABV5C2C0_9BACL